MKMIKGNKGEWSEIYVFLRLLGEGKIYAADEELKKIENLYFPILKIIREDELNKKYEYSIDEAKKTIRVTLNGENMCEYSSKVFDSKATQLYHTIIKSKCEAAFSAEQTEEFIRRVGCTKLKTPSIEENKLRLAKTDITMQVQDPNTGFTPTSGFSIKSELGNPPTLLNASKVTNFIFEVQGLSELDMQNVNNITTRTKILDKLRYIKQNSTSFVFAGVANETFNSNLLVVDSRLPEILAYALSYYYGGKISTCEQAVDMLVSENPLDVKNGKDYYTTKFKKFLTAVALGMTPSKQWNGKDEAVGGYIIVTTSGDVLAYHIYNRNNFEEYLLKTTKFERASTTRYKYSSLYKNNDKMFVDLNLQIRFVK